MKQTIIDDLYFLQWPGTVSCGLLFLSTCSFFVLLLALSFSCLIFCLSFLCSLVSEALFALSFSILSERLLLFFVHA